MSINKALNIKDFKVEAEHSRQQLQLHILSTQSKRLKKKKKLGAGTHENGMCRIRGPQAWKRFMQKDGAGKIMSCSQSKSKGQEPSGKDNCQQFTKAQVHTVRAGDRALRGYLPSQSQLSPWSPAQQCILNARDKRLRKQTFAQRNLSFPSRKNAMKVTNAVDQKRW